MFHSYSHSNPLFLAFFVYTLCITLLQCKPHTQSVFSSCRTARFVWNGSFDFSDFSELILFFARRETRPATFSGTAVRAERPMRWANLALTITRAVPTMIQNLG
ncbi:hypothetical protein BC834DRAFT_67958 [Gloeopeniophorella convolvens]|nr:hypothetical protein BC834DRAFT_67958 [Gloeopeniophorella convolvens]